MAINAIQNAREARVVSSELKRLAGNMSLYLILEALSGKDVDTADQILLGLDRFGDLLLEQASGKKDTEEVFLPEEHLKAAQEGLKDLFGGFGK